MRASNKGFSLIETILFILIVGIALTAIVLQFIQNTRNSDQPFLRQKAVVIASAYMDEILAKRWNEATPVGGGCVDTGTSICTGGPAVIASGTDGENRSEYDDLDDFNGISEQPVDTDGDTLTNYAGFNVAVAVEQPSSNWQGIDLRDVRKITVTVQSSNTETFNLIAYRVNY